jgi:hypothetical protein
MLFNFGNQTISELISLYLRMLADEALYVLIDLFVCSESDWGLLLGLLLLRDHHLTWLHGHLIGVHIWGAHLLVLWHSWVSALLGVPVTTTISILRELAGLPVEWLFLPRSHELASHWGLSHWEVSWGSIHTTHLHRNHRRHHVVGLCPLRKKLILVLRVHFSFSSRF